MGSNNNFEFFMRREMAEIKSQMGVIIDILMTNKQKAQTNQKSQAKISFVTDNLSALFGIMTFEEVCIALDVKPNGQSRVKLKSELMAVKPFTQTKTAYQRFYVFESSPQREAELLSIRASIIANVSERSAWYGLSEVMHRIGLEQTSVSKSMTARALRAMNFERDGGNGKYLIQGILP